ncbi:general transcription factor 3C polypeptide 6 isoform X1 [Syngnathus typhle]|uniref:general transcription factor 3C polypeptide 6 isoform X1 n=1 Tax=Syngnathus typhle TaxID=161592 RepID=UPI002A69C12E|nr:general transcription factor 3C polypeptide 6 isoform X1 [Syngnathus typhle]
MGRRDMIRACVQEQIVVVELSGIINNDAMFKSRGTCKILDIDSEQPMMQVGQYVFAGEYEDAIGTCVLFEEGEGKGGVPELQYKCNTVKKLMMQRVFLSTKKENESDAGAEGNKQGDTVCQSVEETKQEG